MTPGYRILLSLLCCASMTLANASDALSGWGNETVMMKITDVPDVNVISIHVVNTEIRLTLIIENLDDDGHTHREFVVSSTFSSDNGEFTDVVAIGSLTTAITPTQLREYEYTGHAYVTLNFMDYRNTNEAADSAESVDIHRIVQLDPTPAPGKEDGPTVVFPGTTLMLRADRKPDPKTGAYPNGLPYWWMTQPTGSSLADPTAGQSTVTITPMELGNYIVYASLTGILNPADSFEFTVTNVMVTQLTFKAKPSAGSIHPVIKERGNGAYPSIHWQDNSTPLDGDADDLSYAASPPADLQDKKAPVCFVRGSTMRVDVSFKLAAAVPATTAMVKGTGPGGLVFETSAPVTVPAGDEISIGDLDCSGALPNEIKVYDSFDIAWEVKIGTADYVPAGTTRNVIYLLRDTPKGGTTLYHTVVHLSCQYGQTASDHNNPDVVTSKMFEAFTGKNVQQVAIPGELLERPLKYYKPKSGAAVGDANKLLESASNGNGQCSTFAYLFIRMLHAHGIDYANEYVKATSADNDEGFFVKKWLLAPGATGKSGDANYPLLNVPKGAYPFVDGGDNHEWKFAEVTDDTGIEGQNATNPLSIFDNHQFVRIEDANSNVTYYDPSY